MLTRPRHKVALDGAADAVVADATSTPPRYAWHAFAPDRLTIVIPRASLCPVTANGVVVLIRNELESELVRGLTTTLAEVAVPDPAVLVTLLSTQNPKLRLSCAPRSGDQPVSRYEFVAFPA